MEIRQRKWQTMVYDNWAAATETVSLFGCAGQQSDNGWRGLVEPAVPLGFVNAVRGGWRGSSAFVSTFRDAHSFSPAGSSLLSVGLQLSPSCFLLYILYSLSSLSLIIFVFISYFHDSWEAFRRSVTCGCFRLGGGFRTVSPQRLHSSRVHIVSKPLHQGIFIWLP